ARAVCARGAVAAVAAGATVRRVVRQVHARATAEREPGGAAAHRSDAVSAAAAGRAAVAAVVRIGLRVGARAVALGLAARAWVGHALAVHARFARRARAAAGAAVAG